MINVPMTKPQPLNLKGYGIIALMLTKFMDQSEMEALPAVVLKTTVVKLNKLVEFSI